MGRSHTSTEPLRVFVSLLQTEGHGNFTKSKLPRHRLLMQVDVKPAAFLIVTQTKYHVTDHKRAPLIEHVASSSELRGVIEE